MKLIQSFWKDEDGAVTVDWVVLTAGVVLLAVAVSTALVTPINTELGEIAAVVTDTN